MKNLRPSILILLGSLLYLVLSITSALLFHLFVLELSPWVIILIPVISALVVFILFYALLKNFIQNRLHLIYKSIQTKQQVVPFKGSTIDNLISTVEIDVRNWKENKNKEITKLKDQEQFRREFLGNLAHELKTPVFAVQGYILTLIEGGIDDKQVNVQFLERASRATERIVNILEDLDQIAKLEVDALKIEMRSFEMIDLIKEIVETLELKAKEKNISLKFQNDLSSIYVTADRNKISQVLTNLINNAISYGKIDGEVVISAVPIDDLVTIEVKDNGIGIDTEHFPRLFERFYRV